MRDRLTFNEIATSLGVQVSTVWRWARVGIKTNSGERVFLPTSRIGGRIFISREDLNRFQRQLATSDFAASEKTRGV